MLVHLIIHLYYLIEMYINIKIINQHCKNWAQHQHLLRQDYQRFEVTEVETVYTEQASKEEFDLAYVDEDMEIMYRQLLQELHGEEPQMDEGQDYLHISDIEIPEQNYQTGFEEFASANIGDGLVGKQQWVVRVIGIEETFIHVSDGKRIWLNVGERVNKISIGDTLIVSVDRSTEGISVENIFLVDSKPTTEYAIPDEDYFGVFQSQAI